MTTYARVTTRTARLAEPFGVELACRKFGCTEAELEQVLGRFVRGKHKGKLRGAIHWDHVTDGGWDRRRGCVVKPGERLCYRLTAGFDVNSASATVEQIVRARANADNLAAVQAAHPELRPITQQLVAYSMSGNGYSLERAVELELAELEERSAADRVDGYDRDDDRESWRVV